LGTFTFCTDKTGAVTACRFQSATTRHLDFTLKYEASEKVLR
jgi:hypothetical protein